MKNKIVVLLSGVAVMLLSSGCASIKQKAETTTTTYPDGRIVEDKTTANNILAFGGAKNIADKVKAGNTKTAHNLGAAGIEQEAQSPAETLKALSELAKALRPTP
jgi:hypothetical protein